MDSMTVLGRERLWTNARLLMLTAGFDGEILAANPAWETILGWKPEEIVGRSFFDLIHPDDRERTIAEASTMDREGKQVPKFENRYRTALGDYRDIDWTAVSDGEFIHALGRDHTEEKHHAATLAAAEEALRQSQKIEALGQLTGGVAHDFNNLLTVITGSVELLLRPDLPDPKRQIYLLAIRDTAERAAKLTSQLLAFARRQALRPESFDVGQSLLEVSDLIRSLAGARVELKVDMPSDRLYVLADRSQFDTAIVNMAVNARDAMHGEGRLTIGVTPASGIPPRRSHDAVAGDFAAITVADNGSGIAPAALERIFEPFFTTKNVGEGTGLGLSQVFGFAKQSGGDIDVSSEMGKGTWFTLYLPRTHPKIRPAPRHRREPAIDANGICVLVVEDNQRVGEFATEALRELGFDSVLAIDGKQALEELAHDCDRFHIVFSDVVMPGMSGIEFGERVKRDYPKMPVILTSGYSHVLAEEGMRDFELLQKPYSLDQLALAVRQALAQTRSKAPSPAV